MNLIPFLSTQPWTERVAWALLHFVWQGALIAVLFEIGRRFLLYRSRAELRYAAGCAALAVMTLAPLLTFSLIGLEPEHSLPAAQRFSLTDTSLIPPMTWAMTAKREVSRFGSKNALPYIVIFWLAGVCTFSLRFVGGWIMATRLRATGALPRASEWQHRLDDLRARLRMSRPVQLWRSAFVQVPAVVGIFRPVVLLPLGALSGLSTPQVEALLLHELAHIRRHDYLVNIAQNFVEALLFYQPAVWWISRQIRIERELCCDDIAVAVTCDPLTYAEALTELETLRTTPMIALGAAGSSLTNRILRLLDSSKISRPAIGSLALPASLIVAILIIAAGVSGTHAQNLDDPRFAEISIRLNLGGGHDVLMPGSVRVLPGSELLAGWVNVRTLIEYAYNLKPYELGEGPDWMDSIRYDVQAKASSDVSPEQMQLMLQVLLRERFTLRIRREPEERPMYVMNVGSNGPGVQSAKAGSCRISDPNNLIPPPPPPPPSIFTAMAWITPQPSCGRFTLNVKSVSEARLQAGYVTMGDFAHYLSTLLDTPVLDNTGYSAPFDIYLSFIPGGQLQDLRASLIVAIREQLGVQVSPTKGSVDLLVIDHVEKPALN